MGCWQICRYGGHPRIHWAKGLAFGVPEPEMDYEDLLSQGAMVMVTSCSLLFFIVLSRHLTQAWIKSQLCFPHSSIPTGPN